MQLASYNFVIPRGLTLDARSFCPSRVYQVSQVFYKFTQVDMRVDRTLPWRDDHVPRDLVLGDALFDLGHELRRVAVDHLPDFRPELME